MDAVNRRQRTAWSQEEEDAVEQGFERHGSNWAAIKKDPEFSNSLTSRSNVQIKDKYRTILRRRERGLVTNSVDKENDWLIIPALEAYSQRKLQPSQEEWTRRERKALIEGIKRHGFGKWRQIKADHPTALKTKDPMTMEAFWKTIRDVPTEEPGDLDYCVLCQKEPSDPGVSFPRVAVGRFATHYYTTCSLCLQIPIAGLAVFFSPMSGSSLKTQEMFLEYCHDSQLPPTEAFKAIHMDHDVNFKADSMSTLATLQQKGQEKAKEKPFYKEWLQGRCVPIHGMDHAIISKTDIVTQHEKKTERVAYLRRRRKQVKTEVLENEIIGDLGMSVDKFMSSDLFWGMDEKNGSRRPLKACLKALRTRWQELLNKSKTSPALLWFVKLGHQRLARVLDHVPKNERPDDFKEIEDILVEAEAKGPMEPPIHLVTVEEIQRDVYREYYKQDGEHCDKKANEPDNYVTISCVTSDESNASDSESDASDSE